MERYLVYKLKDGPPSQNPAGIQGDFAGESEAVGFSRDWLEHQREDVALFDREVEQVVYERRLVTYEGLDYVVHLVRLLPDSVKRYEIVSAAPNTMVTLGEGTADVHSLAKAILLKPNTEKLRRVMNTAFPGLEVIATNKAD